MSEIRPTTQGNSQSQLKLDPPYLPPDSPCWSLQTCCANPERKRPANLVQNDSCSFLADRALCYETDPCKQVLRHVCQDDSTHWHVCHQLLSSSSRCWLHDSGSTSQLGTKTDLLHQTTILAKRNRPSRKSACRGSLCS
uniref:(northern house mosquito) hypothetical protein n=1 Tax=Culex pipiens TaxID=7175 RepID=A0A8D8JIB8_CULPI